MSVHVQRQLARTIARASQAGTPLRHARGVVVSSTIGTTVVTLDGGATNVTAFNYGHVQLLAAGTVVDVLLVGKKAYILGAYGVTALTSNPAGTAQGTNTTAASGSVVQLGFGSATTYGGVTFASNAFTVPAAGLYSVSLMAFANFAALSSVVVLAVYKNGASFYGKNTNVAGAYWWGDTVTLDVPCAAGDTISGSFEQLSGSSVTVGAGQARLSVHLAAR